MKKFKQIFSLILAIFMLITAVPMQSFAVFDFFYITIDELEYAGEVAPISYKSVISQRISEDVEYAFFYDNPYYNITLSDGKLYENKWGIVNYKSIRSISFIERINIDDCIKAYEQGNKTVNVEVEAFIQYANNKYNVQNFTLERPLVKEIVKNITFVDTLPEIKEDDYNLNFNFVGKKFEIEYADGTKKVAAVEEAEFDFLLDGESISISNDDKYYYDDVTGEKVYYTGITVKFIDATTIINKQVHTCNYSSIELLDYSFNDDAKLVSVSYRLTHKGGNVIEKTCTFDEKSEVDAYGYTTVDTIDGYDIKVRMHISPAVFRQNSYCFVEIIYGLDGWNLIDSECIYDFTEICDCRCHKSGIIYLFNQILFKLQEIFGRETECQCGTAHSAVS
jgi:hypothetical protein